MKKIKFLILALGLLAAQGVLAVQLPSSSYTPHSSDNETVSVPMLETGTLIKGSFHSLGTTACTEQSEGGCSNCCATETGLYACIADCDTDECEDACAVSTGYNDCVKECKGGDVDPLPLDGGHWILLTLAILSGIVTVIMGRAKYLATRSEK